MLRRVAVCTLALAGVAAACGLDVVGTFAAGAKEDAGQEDDASIDRPPDGVDAAGIDADATVDAGPRCAFVTVTDPLTALLGDGGDGWFVSHDISNGDHPKIDPSSEGPAVSLITPDVTSSAGAIWRAPLPVHAFDVSFRYIITCDGGCSDGLGLLWIESHDGGAPELFPPTSANTFAIPPGFRGSGVVLDVRSDTVANDPATPSLSVIAIDPTKTPGTYDWHVTNGSPDAGYLGSHHVAVRLRKESGLTATVDGVDVLTTPTVLMDFNAWFGIGASVASDKGTFVVRDFKAAFYECDDP
jgi:hypothetical protein